MASWMKPLAYIFLITLAVISCSKAPTEEQAPIEEIPENVTVMGDIESEKFLVEIIGSSGIIRGFNFGIPIDSILKNESLELFEDRPSHVGFVHERSTLESADVLYLRDSQNKLIGADIDIYLNTPASADALFATAQSHYNAMFEKSPNDTLTWLIKPSGYIKVQQVKKELDNGLEIKYRQ